MAKLKFDRTVNLNLESNDTVTVPNNEVWRGSLFTAGSFAEVNGRNIETKNNASVPVLTLGGGATLKGMCSFTGVAFKIIQ